MPQKTCDYLVRRLLQALIGYYLAYLYVGKIQRTVERTGESAYM